MITHRQPTFAAKNVSESAALPSPQPQAPNPFRMDLLQAPHTDRIAARREAIASAAAFAPLMVVMHGTRYVTALRRMAFSSVKLCAAGCRVDDQLQ